jgi:hypothetical protein
MSKIVAGGHVHTARTLYPKWRSFEFLQSVGKAGSGVSSVERGQERRWRVHLFALEQAMKAQSGSRSISLFFLQPQRYMGEGVNAAPRPLYPREAAPFPIVQEAGWAPGTVWTGVENLAPYRDSIHRLSKP